MNTDTAAEFLVKKFQKERERIVVNMTRGMEFGPYYHRAVGQVEGLDYAIDLIKHTAQKVANDEELDDE
jgi:hypothetical protein